MTMPTTHRISSLAAIAMAATALTLPAAATARPIYDTGTFDETSTQHVAPSTVHWLGYNDVAPPAHARLAPAAAVSDDGVPLPMAGGVIAIVILSLGGAAATVKRRKTVRPALPTS